MVKKGFKHPEAVTTYFNYNTRFLQTPTPDDKKLDQTYVSLQPDRFEHRRSRRGAEKT
ncbi:hypothetical protein VQ056_02075 [Paenibacillus sp. JTLBN-2024]